MPSLRLAQVLKRKKLSKRKFAKLVDVHYKNVFAYFRPGYNPRFSQLCLWAKVLGCKVTSLIDDKP